MTREEYWAKAKERGLNIPFTEEKHINEYNFPYKEMESLSPELNQYIRQLRYLLRYWSTYGSIKKKVIKEIENEATDPLNSFTYLTNNILDIKPSKETDFVTSYFL